MSHQRLDILSRRVVVSLGATGLASAVLGGCDLFSTQPSKKAGTRPPTPTAAATEPPRLAALVRAGKLPPLKARLPKNPAVTKPYASPGTYGGTWRQLTNDSTGNAFGELSTPESALMRWNAHATTVVPNLAEAVTANVDGSEFIVKLREGTKWSDGEPFTADDFVFTFEDIYQNKTLSPDGPPRFLRIAHKTASSVERVDDNTVKVTFPAPSGLFQRLLATPWGFSFPAPAHYLKRYHKKYNPDVDELVKEAGQDNWGQLFWTKDSSTNPEMPTLAPWRITAISHQGKTTAERNPYFWMTDTAGRQLPYIDNLEAMIVSDEETMVLKAISGEVDMQANRISPYASKPVYARNRTKEGYYFVDTIPGQMNAMLIMFNLTIKDPIKRELFRNRDFRIGLSYAINRPEIIKAVYQSQGEPWQGAPTRDSRFYDEEMAKQYTEFDPDKANEYLDRAGYSERDASGIRIGPGGKPIQFPFQNPLTSGVGGFNNTDALQLIKGYWRKVGVDISIDSISSDLWNTRLYANELNVHWWTGDGGLIPLIVPQFYFPYGTQTQSAMLWGEWYDSNGKRGEAPPAAPRRQMELYDQIMTTGGKDKQDELMKELLKISKEQFYTIGINLTPPGYGIVKNDFDNVPRQFLNAYYIGTLGIIRPAQCYFER